MGNEESKNQLSKRFFQGSKIEEMFKNLAANELNGTRDRLVHIEDKLDGISSGSIRESLERLLHIEEKLDDVSVGKYQEIIKRLLSIKAKINDISDEQLPEAFTRLVNLEEKLDEMSDGKLQQTLERMTGIETAVNGVAGDRFSETQTRLSNLQKSLDEMSGGKLQQTLERMTGIETAVNGVAGDRFSETQTRLSNLQKSLDEMSDGKLQQTLERMTGIETAVNGVAGDRFSETQTRLSNLQKSLDEMSDGKLQQTLERMTGIETAVNGVAGDRFSETQTRLMHVEEKIDEASNHKLVETLERLIHIENKVDQLFAAQNVRASFNIRNTVYPSQTDHCLNIVFSTTRQWNPGDEFILKGVRNIFNHLGIYYNALIFNRNPDIRSQFESKYRASRVPDDFNLHERTRVLEANIKFGMFDNSVKPDMDLSFADWVIFAGTPEWCNGRCADLYELILENQIPIMVIGVGGAVDCYKENYKEVIKKAKLVTVREHTTLRSLSDLGVNASCICCPSILSALPHQEKQIFRVNSMALIYQATKRETVIWNGSSEELYKFEIALYRRIIEEYGESMDIYLVCHYIDEVPLAIRDFPNAKVRYSYDSEEYMDIYHKADLVIGPRVHGVGISASMLIPGIALIHDARGETCEGFKAKTIHIGQTMDDCMGIIQDTINSVARLNMELLLHKRNVMDEYINRVGSALTDRHVTYNAKAEVNRARYDLKKLDLSDLSKVINHREKTTRKDE